GDPGEVTPPGQAPGEEDDPAVGEVQDRADAGADSAILFLEMPVGVGFEGAQIAAQGVLGGELEVESWPHVTVLYLGKLGSAVSAVRAAADATVKDFLKETKTRIDLMPARIGHFGDGTPGPDGVPVIIHYYSWGLEELQNALLRRLADKVNVPQFPRFIPHATLGYLPREMTSEESAALANLQTDGLRDWAPMTLALRVGEEVVARIPLVSGRVDEE
ncbi:MAG: 2'-5' RNA ligase family protein, partial [Myxococcota bacterium]